MGYELTLSVTDSVSLPVIAHSASGNIQYS